MELSAADIRQYKDKFYFDEIKYTAREWSKSDLLWSPDGNLLLMAHWYNRRLNYELFDVADNERIDLDQLEHYLLTPTFSPDSRFVVYSSPAELKIVDIKSLRTESFSLRELIPDDYRKISRVQFAANKTGDILFFSLFGRGMLSPSAFLWRSADPGQLEIISGLEFMEKPDLPGET
jgi:WD40 repeat protein